MYEYNRMKLPYFVLKVRLRFTDLFWIRIQNLGRFRIGSGSGQKFRILPDPVPDPQHCLKLSFHGHYTTLSTLRSYSVSTRFLLSSYTVSSPHSRFYNTGSLAQYLFKTNVVSLLYFICFECTN